MNVTVPLTPAIILPFIIGLVFPFLTTWISSRGWPTWIESFLNFALSALTSAALNTTFDGNWQTFLLALGTAWMGSLRSHYLGAPQRLYSKRVTHRHEKQDQVE